jgi:hypothetical protein
MLPQYQLLPNQSSLDIFNNILAGAMGGGGGGLLTSSMQAAAAAAAAASGAGAGAGTTSIFENSTTEDAPPLTRVTETAAGAFLAGAAGLVVA